MIDFSQLLEPMSKAFGNLAGAMAGIQAQASQGQSLAGQTITAGGHRFRVGLSRLYMVLPITVTATTTETVGTKVFNAPRDLLVEHITAWCSDAAGLAAFRLGWFQDNGLSTDFFSPDPDDTAPVYPVASTLLTDAGILRLDRPNLVFLKDSKRTFKAIDVSGTAPYTVNLTFHLRHLERQ